MISALDKTVKKELIAPKSFGNDLKCYVDRPNQFDAWDVDIEYEQMSIVPESVRLIAHHRGPVFDRMCWEFRFGSSTIEQTVELAAGSRELKFITQVNWQETHKMLRVDFPLNLEFDSVRCEQGFGFIRRSSKRNTPQEKHCFEFSAQRFIAAGDGKVRAGLLSDCKYGYKACGNCIGLNLLRSPRYPDEITDRGLHEFTYSLVFSVNQAYDRLIRETAYALNRPALRFDNYTGTIQSLIKSLEICGVTIESIKVAEDDPRARVIRLAEQYGEQTAGMIKLNGSYQWSESDLLERLHENWNSQSDQITLSFEPFELKTLIVK